jgi:hypothetical protein
MGERGGQRLGETGGSGAVTCCSQFFIILICATVA